MKIEAAVTHGMGEEFEIGEVELAEPRSNEVLRFQNVVHQAVDLLLRFAQAHHEAGFPRYHGCG